MSAAKFADITDGSSNTAMIWEDAARPAGYNRFRTLFSYGNGPIDGVSRVVSGGGGAWADCNSDTHIGGAFPNGIRYNGGTCLMNCTTDNEVYSFHPGGSNVAFADGSVHFVKETVNPSVFFALISRKAGEITSSDQY
jgi:prepilin-type processing-associated H-X9-DG protein